VKTTKILVGVTPSDADIKRDGKDLGAPPLLLELADGEVANLTITRDGFDSKTVQVKATDGKQNVVLTKTVSPFAQGRPPVPPPNTGGQPPKPPGNNPFTAPGSNTGSGDPFAHP
jgi:hypothetical protein